jgi:hypothetical protein
MTIPCRIQKKHQVDVDELEELMAEAGVTAMPTFQLCVESR